MQTTRKFYEYMGFGEGMTDREHIKILQKKNKELQERVERLEEEVDERAMAFYHFITNDCIKRPYAPKKGVYEYIPISNYSSNEWMTVLNLYHYWKKEILKQQ